MKNYCLLVIIAFFGFVPKEETGQWIRINQLGYQPASVKVAVWCSKGEQRISTWELVDATSNTVVLKGRIEKLFGAYGPFAQTARLNFTSFKKPGTYYLKAGTAISPQFRIADDVYKGAADFCLRYMRQQRSGFNPFLKDSCHTQDGYTLYGKEAGLPDSTHIDVSGGWHDASDYLQYSTTSANATYHLLMAYRDFPNVFGDEKLANGLNGKNNLPDVLDEAKWGLDWLLKMHPRDDWMFNQLGDDRDHISMRIPKMDSQYGKGFERPVYFIDGKPQQRGKFLNNTTGTSSTAGKFASAFMLGTTLLDEINPEYADSLSKKGISSFFYSFKKQGVTQTVSVRAPYIYAEQNWEDDIELAATSFYYAQSYEFNKFKNQEIYVSPGRPDPDLLDFCFRYAKQEPITPWLGNDTANHYQWYPFINIGHYELAKQLKDKRRDTIITFYKEGIQRVWNKAKQNAFYRGVPFIWCSNNLTVSFAIQCYWYQQLTNDKQFAELEQANFDWLFGCNPWGTSMVYGLPSWGDTPVDPHSAFTHLKNYPIDGGLVDGPVYTSIFKNLIGLTLYNKDEYAPFQSELAVYHDDYGDYSTNEPTMDGTASLIYLLAAKETQGPPNYTWKHGAVIRGDTTKKELALVFTGHEFAEGGSFIQQTLRQQSIKASFFLTGDFYRKRSFQPLIQQLKRDGHYLGAHSDQHLLYCDWKNRDSLLVTQEQFTNDLLANLDIMAQLNINTYLGEHKIFLPPYEWYNDSIAQWCSELGIQLINYSPGTKTATDYTWPGLPNYQSSEAIYQSIINFEKKSASGLNGFILLLHVGTDARRTDKFYKSLPQLLQQLKAKGYRFKSIDQLLNK
ncbi:MAG: polysaccharide deacetylase family protein [Lacibacter sp.]|jgi:peptidoglycan/xylan/chitin deacetylase (PgdA/CDA1 family)